jgi:deoxyribodipyrimidine photolyase
VPELRDIEAELFTEPPTDPLVENYPLPMVDHAKERLETLERFNQVRR